MHSAADPPPGIYLDDSAFAYDTVEALQRLGLRVVTPLDAGLLGAQDAAHTAYAAGAGLAILTKNPRDFPPGEHAGILAVYQDNDPGRDMSPADIARGCQRAGSRHPHRRPGDRPQPLALLAGAAAARGPDTTAAPAPAGG